MAGGWCAECRSRVASEQQRGAAAAGARCHVGVGPCLADSGAAAYAAAATRITAARCRSRAQEPAAHAGVRAPSPAAAAAPFCTTLF